MINPIIELGLRRNGEWSGYAKVLGKFSVPGRSTNLKESRPRAYCDWACLDIYLASIISLFFLLLLYID